jgi:bile acid:Na+ symporter, BASS family
MGDNSTLNVILQLILFVLMLGIGMTLRIVNLSKTFAMRRALLIGILIQVTLLPIAGILINNIFSFPPEIQLGIIILVGCPGGFSSNIMSFLLKGDVAFSVTLSSLSSIVQLITLPIFVSFAIDHYHTSNIFLHHSIDRTNLLLNLILLTILPTLIGMLVRLTHERFAIKCIPILKSLSTIVLLASVVGLVIEKGKELLKYFTQLGLAMLLMTLMLLAVSYIIGKLIKLTNSQAKTLAIETSVLNNLLCIVICTSLLHTPTAATAAVVYGPTMIIIGFIFMFFLPQEKLESEV